MFGVKKCWNRKVECLKAGSSKVNTEGRREGNKGAKKLNLGGGVVV